MAKFNLYGDIEGDASAAGTLQCVLASDPNGPIEVRVFSAGGDALEGFAIYCALRDHAGPTTAIVDGFAGSAAALVLNGCRTIKMHAAALLYLHQPWITASGNEDTLGKRRELIGQVQQIMVDAYVARTGRSADEVLGWMKSETYFTAAQAKALGLVDEVIPLAAPGGVAARGRALQVMAKLETPPAQVARELQRLQRLGALSALRAGLRTFQRTQAKQLPETRKMNAEELQKKLGLASDASADDVVKAAIAYLGTDATAEDKEAVLRGVIALLSAEPDGDEGGGGGDEAQAKALMSEIGALRAQVEKLTGEKETPEAKAKAAADKAKAAVDAGQWPASDEQNLAKLYASGKEPQLFKAGMFNRRGVVYTQNGRPLAQGQPNFGEDTAAKEREAVKAKAASIIERARKNLAHLN